MKPTPDERESIQYEMNALFGNQTTYERIFDWCKQSSVGCDCNLGDITENIKQLPIPKSNVTYMIPVSEQQTLLREYGIDINTITNRAKLDSLAAKGILRNHQILGLQGIEFIFVDKTITPDEPDLVYQGERFQMPYGLPDKMETDSDIADLVEPDKSLRQDYMNQPVPLSSLDMQEQKHVYNALFGGTEEKLRTEATGGQDPSEHEFQ